MQNDSYEPAPGSTGAPARRGNWTSEDVIDAIEAIKLEIPNAWTHLSELETSAKHVSPQSLDGAVADDLQLGVLGRRHSSASFMQIADLAWLVRLERRRRLKLEINSINLNLSEPDHEVRQDFRPVFLLRRDLVNIGRQLVDQPNEGLPEARQALLLAKKFTYVAMDLDLHQARLGTASYASAIDSWLIHHRVPIEVHASSSDLLDCCRKATADLDDRAPKFKKWVETAPSRKWQAWEVEEAFEALRYMFPAEWTAWRRAESQKTFNDNDPMIAKILYKGIEIVHPEAVITGGFTSLFGLLREHMINDITSSRKAPDNE